MGKPGDARRKFWIKPLKETDLGVAQAFYIFSCATLKETFTAKYDGVLPRTPKWDHNPKFTALSETTSIPTPFICGVSPPPGGKVTFANNVSFVVFEDLYRQKKQNPAWLR